MSRGLSQGWTLSLLLVSPCCPGTESRPHPPAGAAHLPVTPSCWDPVQVLLLAQAKTLPLPLTLLLSSCLWPIHQPFLPHLQLLSLTRSPQLCPLHPCQLPPQFHQSLLPWCWLPPWSTLSSQAFFSSLFESFVYLFELERGRDRESKSFHLLVHPPDSCNTKAGTWLLTQALGPFSAARQVR